MGNNSDSLAPWYPLLVAYSIEPRFPSNPSKERSGFETKCGMARQ